MWCEQNREFNFRYVEFEVHIGSPNGNISKQKIRREIFLVKVNNLTFHLSSTPEVYDILVTVIVTISGRQVHEEE